MLKSVVCSESSHNYINLWFIDFVIIYLWLIIYIDICVLDLNEIYL